MAGRPARIDQPLLLNERTPRRLDHPTLFALESELMRRLGEADAA
jgi:hypothetical protein